MGVGGGGRASLFKKAGVRLLLYSCWSEDFFFKYHVSPISWFCDSLYLSTLDRKRTESSWNGSRIDTSDQDFLTLRLMTSWQLGINAHVCIPVSISKFKFTSFLKWSPPSSPLCHITEPCHWSSSGSSSLHILNYVSLSLVATVDVLPDLFFWSSFFYFHLSFSFVKQWVVNLVYHLPHGNCPRGEEALMAHFTDFVLTNARKFFLAKTPCTKRVKVLTTNSFVMTIYITYFVFG